MFCVEVSSPHAGIQVVPQRLQSLNCGQQLTFILQSQTQKNKPDIKKQRNSTQIQFCTFSFCVFACCIEKYSFNLDRTFMDDLLIICMLYLYVMQNSWFLFELVHKVQ